MTDLVKLLSELIALPSVNPAFVEPASTLAGERLVAEFLVRTAANAGLDVQLSPVLPDRDNVIIRLTPRGRIRRRIVLAPHMDTVGASGSQLKPVLKDGRIHGRGACDTKGSVAAMLGALLDVAAGKNRPSQTEIIFTGLIDEENNQSGSRALAKARFKADLAIVGEPTLCEVVSAHKGDLWLKLTTKGVAAHGATPSFGRNAILEMARVVQLLETDYAASLKARTHPLLGSPTINVGSIKGGRQPNIVPDLCETSADRRTLPGETRTTVRRELAALFKKHGLAVTVADTKGAPCLPMETSGKLPLVQLFLKAAQRKQSLGVHYFCDASVFSNAGTPSIVFGPGDIAQAHTADEWVAVSELERARAVLVKFLRSLP